MFTGIVLGTAPIHAIVRKSSFQTHTLRFPQEWLEGLEIGASVAHNGCCLTVTSIEGSLVSFDLIDETLAKTNLGQLQEGDAVNIERAAKFGDEIGGHLMSGHIVCQAQIHEIERTETNYKIVFSLEDKWAKFVMEKGYIGIDGMSLTIGQVDAQGFAVHLIPETLSRTTIGSKSVGDWVNLEVDPQTQAIVSTVERILAQK